MDAVLFDVTSSQRQGLSLLVGQELRCPLLAGLKMSQNRAVMQGRDARPC